MNTKNKNNNNISFFLGTTILLTAVGCGVIIGIKYLALKTFLSILITSSMIALLSTFITDDADRDDI